MKSSSPGDYENELAKLLHRSKGTKYELTLQKLLQSKVSHHQIEAASSVKDDSVAKIVRLDISQLDKSANYKHSAALKQSKDERDKRLFALSQPHQRNLRSPSPSPTVKSKHNTFPYSSPRVSSSPLLLRTVNKEMSTSISSRKDNSTGRSNATSNEESTLTSHPKISRISVKLAEVANIKHMEKIQKELIDSSCMNGTHKGSNGSNSILDVALSPSVLAVDVNNVYDRLALRGRLTAARSRRSLSVSPSSARCHSPSPAAAINKNKGKAPVPLGSDGFSVNRRHSFNFSSDGIAVDAAMHGNRNINKSGNSVSLISLRSSNRQSPSPYTEDDRHNFDSMRRYFSLYIKNQNPENVITLHELELAFRKHQNACRLQPREEYERSIVFKFEHLLFLNNLSYIDWFYKSDVRGAVGGTGKVTLLELSDSINSLCISSDLATWSNSDLHCLMKYMNEDGTDTLTEADMSYAYDKYHHQTKCIDIISMAGNEFKELELVMYKQLLRVKDLYNQVANKHDGSVAVDNLIDEIKLLFHKLPYTSKLTTAKARDVGKQSKAPFKVSVTTPTKAHLYIDTSPHSSTSTSARYLCSGTKRILQRSGRDKESFAERNKKSIENFHIKNIVADMLQDKTHIYSRRSGRSTTPTRSHRLSYHSTLPSPSTRPTRIAASSASPLNRTSI